MKVAKRIARLRERMAQEKLDAYAVRSVTDLLWLTGFQGVFDTEEAHTAVITAGTLNLHSDSRYATALRACAAEEGLWDIDDTAPMGAGEFVAATLEQQGLQTGRVGVDNSMSLRLYRSFETALPQAQLIERQGDVEQLRAVKDAAEIECMKRAQAVADAAFEEFFATLKPGMSEREASLALEFALRCNGADELAFANIVASGPNSANPHSVPGQRTLQHGDLVVVDFGARVDGYRSDTTRTICIGAADAEQQRIYDAVLLANQTVRAAVKPGVTGAAMHELAESVLADAGFAGCMGHGLGHGVGLDIHEAPALSPRNKEQLVAGNVVTIEPGVYIAGQNGVRVEDCGVITCSGYENFSSLSHELWVVE